jgi:predicted transcriptional regulator
MRHGSLEAARENRHIDAMTTLPKPLSTDEAVSPVMDEAPAEVKAWQAEKIKAGLRDADQGRFASKEAVEAIVQKFIPNG